MGGALIVQSAAARLMSRFQPIDVHRRIASILATGDLKYQFLFEAVDSAIIATTLSEETPKASTVALVLEAAERAAMSASSMLAYRYSQVLEGEQARAGLES